ncbi:MAG TPA: ARMT1-like domain-containing protein [Phycisphaerae bacterium]|nr:ARMT1-like domain-containing protein [Phycisphaerae bacterium]
MRSLCRLKHPDRYRVSTWNLAEDPQVKRYWLDLFESFPKRIEQHLRDDGAAGPEFDRQWAALCGEYEAGMRAIRAQVERTDTLYTIDLCRFRQTLLDHYGFLDPYLGVKRRENDLAAALYPQVIDQIDTTPPWKRWDLLLRGLLAGNMFDLGAPKTIEMYQRGQVDFVKILKGIRAQPWFIDQTDALLERLGGKFPWRQVLFFVDNAGADIALGVIPVAREMICAGTRVVLAPNTSPALNDITLAELNPLLERLAAGDAILAGSMADGRLRTVDSGGDTPLIDLGAVSDACDAVAADSDLIVLEGMGRGVESNWAEQFTCDVWRVALLKDHTVADWIGGHIFDGVCRFDPAG